VKRTRRRETATQEGEGEWGLGYRGSGCGSLSCLLIGAHNKDFCLSCATLKTHDKDTCLSCVL
jgi:hypothetical protein